MTKKRILVISDSLGLPRENPDGMVYYHETWPSLLKQNFEVVHLGIEGATIDMLVSQAGYYRFCKPDIIIVQSGIVDCAPRTLSKKEKEFWLNFPIINKVVFRLITKFPSQIRNYRKISLTSPEQFKFQLNKLKDLFNEKPLYFISIAKAHNNYDKLVPGVSNKIKAFNLILESVAKSNFISLNNMPDEFISSDYHHLNTKGHSYISNQLLEKLNNFNV